MAIIISGTSSNNIDTSMFVAHSSETMTTPTDVTLKSVDGVNQLAPRTKAKNVTTEDNKTVETVINDLDVKLNALHTTDIYTRVTSGLGTKEFRMQAVPMDSVESYVKRVILLMPMCRVNEAWNNMCVGTFVLSKNGSNIFDVIDVKAQSCYNSTSAGIITMGQNPTGQKLVTCNYNGIEWLALSINYQANPYNNIWFYGISTVQKNDSDRLKCLAYYNENTATAIISEINSSLVDFTPNLRMYVNGKSTYTSSGTATPTGGADGDIYFKYV